MGLVISVVAGISAFFAELTVAAAMAGTSAEAVTASFELSVVLGESAEDVMAGEEFTLFSGETAEAEGYVDEGAINDAWNWSPIEGTTRSTFSGVARSRLAQTVGSGIVAASVIGAVAGTQLEGDQGLDMVRAVFNPESSGDHTVSDTMERIMTPEEYIDNMQILSEEYSNGMLSRDLPLSVAVADYSAAIGRSGRLAHRTRETMGADKSDLLIFSAMKSEPKVGSWTLPGADGIPITRAAWNRYTMGYYHGTAAQMREMLAHGEVLRQAGQNIWPLFQRAAHLAAAPVAVALDAALDVPQDGVRQQLRGIGRRAAHRLAGDAGVAVAQLGDRVANALVAGGNRAGHQAVETVIAALTYGVTEYFSSTSSPKPGPDAIEIEDDPDLPKEIEVDGRTYVKEKADLHTVTHPEGTYTHTEVHWYEPTERPQIAPGYDTAFKYAEPRSPDQMLALTEVLGYFVHGYDITPPLTTSQRLILSALTLQVARRHASRKRRIRGTEHRSRSKRKREA
ncbi:VP2 [Thetapolyomavirus trebernacchii]|uniref:VP2 n=1 Tax=Thetapolyomavirus trebernacchii TaxID=2218588 RepID=A0A2U9K629_9POLY|nr:VP2 [Thetapolyomavirus trebernacchii]AWS21316.1 VP2 [Thetapolyomavirus trebernacchii]